MAVYSVGKDGRTYDMNGKPVMDGHIEIDQIRRNYKTGEVSYVLIGGDMTGREITLTVPAERFFDHRRLRVDIQSRFNIDCRTHFGRYDKIYNVIMDTTDSSKMIESCEVDQVLWIDEKLIVPGLEPKGYKCNLDKTLFPYHMPDNLDLDTAIDALDHILHAWPIGNTLPIMTLVLAGPVLGKLFPDYRYGYALVGETGSGKTLFARLALSVYGTGFRSTDSMIKLGEGSTANAARKIFAQAGVMPCLMDNYKPYKIWSQNDLSSLIHSVMEGGDKARLDKESELRDAPKYYTCPILTGEDFALDPASQARIMPIDWPRFDPAELDMATEEMREHLPAMGIAWLTWLPTEEGMAAMEEFKEEFPKRRQEMIEIMRDLGAANPERLGSNMALSDLSYKMICKHPTIGWYFEQHKDDFRQNMEETRKQVATTTKESSEAEELVELLRNAVTRGDFSYFISKDKTTGEEFIYIYPDQLLTYAKQNLDGAQKLSRKALGRQLVSHGFVIPDDDENPTCVTYWQGRSVRVYRFKVETLIQREPKDENALDTPIYYHQSNKEAARERREAISALFN